MPEPVAPPASRPVGPLRALWRYANGYMPSYPDVPGGTVAWCRTSHRGVQKLDAIHIPKKQRPYVFNKRFAIRYDAAFERVVRHCADPSRDRAGQTWMSTGVIDAYVALHRLGFAYSFEAWEGGELAGGGFGVRIGAYVSVDSMFHLTDDASKSAYVQMLLTLRDRGFDFVDVNEPSPFMARWGAAWVPGWQFDEMLRRAIGQNPVFADGSTSPRLPWALKAALPARRLAARVARLAAGARRRLAARPAETVGGQGVEAPLDARIDVDVLRGPGAPTGGRPAGAGAGVGVANGIILAAGGGADGRGTAR